MNPFSLLLPKAKSFVANDSFCSEEWGFSPNEYVDEGWLVGCFCFFGSLGTSYLNVGGKLIGLSLKPLNFSLNPDLGWISLNSWSALIASSNSTI